MCRLFRIIMRLPVESVAGHNLYVECAGYPGIANLAAPDRASLAWMPKQLALCRTARTEGNER
jgi:hypothetical protein